MDVSRTAAPKPSCLVLMVRDESAALTDESSKGLWLKKFDCSDEKR